MNIDYKKRHLNINLILGLVWLAFFFFGVFGKEEPNWTDYGWGVIALLYLAMYAYQKHYKYLSIKDGTICINGPLRKKVNLSDVTQIKKFAGDYILITDTKKLTISTQSIDPDALTKLTAELEKMDVEWV